MCFEASTRLIPYGFGSEASRHLQSNGVGGKFKYFPINFETSISPSSKSPRIFRRDIKISENPTISKNCGSCPLLSSGFDAPALICEVRFSNPAFELFVHS